MTDIKILNDFKFVIQFNVAWGEMDALGHVNSAKYLTYFETARIRYYENLKLLDFFQLNQIVGVVSKAECHYLIPLKFPDLLSVGTKTSNFNSDYIIIEHYVKSKSLGLAAYGETEIVFIDKILNKRIKVPNLLINEIKRFEIN